MKSDEYFAQWQRMKNHTLDALLVQPSFLKPVNVKNTEHGMPLHSPDECPCAEKIVQLEEQITFLQTIVTAYVKDMQGLRKDIDDWIPTVEERITTVAARLLGINDNVTAHPV